MGDEFVTFFIGYFTSQIVINYLFENLSIYLFKHLWIKIKPKKAMRVSLNFLKVNQLSCKDYYKYRLLQDNLI